MLFSLINPHCKIRGSIAAFGIILATSISGGTVYAQTLETEDPQGLPESDVEAVDFKFIEELLPGTESMWSKLVCDFKAADPWTDDITFKYSVIVDPQVGNRKRYRNLTGELTYSNIKKGVSSAVMYLSPNATSRFGEPLAARVEIVINDQVVDSIDWLPASSATSYNELTEKRAPAYRGILLSMGSTPWFVHDMERTPDLVR